MDNLGNILQNYLPSPALGRSVSASVIVAKANEELVDMFTEAITSYARAAFFRDGILSIACLSTSAMQGIRLREAELLERLRSRPGGENIRRIAYASSSLPETDY